MDCKKNLNKIQDASSVSFFFVFMGGRGHDGIISTALFLVYMVSLCAFVISGFTLFVRHTYTGQSMYDCMWIMMRSYTCECQTGGPHFPQTKTHQPLTNLWWITFFSHLTISTVAPPEKEALTLDNLLPPLSVPSTLPSFNPSFCLSFAPPFTVAGGAQNSETWQREMGVCVCVCPWVCACTGAWFAFSATGHQSLRSPKEMALWAALKEMGHVLCVSVLDGRVVKKRREKRLIPPCA